MDAGWIRNDGGRAAAGFQGTTGDCVTRAIAIATGIPYRTVYEELRGRLQRQRRVKNPRRRSPRNGVPRKIYEPYLFELGWCWTPTMQIGSGCTVHLTADELPPGRLVVALSRHMTAVIDGVVHDTYDPRRPDDETMRETRCVYGYYRW